MQRLTDGNFADWALGIGLMGLLAICVFVAWWALFSDRSRGRRRCPRCWYDMAYNGMTCPECGTVIRQEKNLARTRRRWGRAMIGIVGAALVGGYVIERANTRGWLTYIPAPILARLMPYSGSANSSIPLEFVRRLNANTIEHDQILAVLRHVVRGDGDTAPPDTRWIAKYERFIAAATRHLEANGSDEELRHAAALLGRLPLRVDLNTRETWPIGVGPTVNVVARDWWPSDVHGRIEARPALPDAIHDVHVRLGNPIQLRSYSLMLPPLDEGHHEVDIDFTYFNRTADDQAWNEVGRQTETIIINVEDEPEKTLTPISGEEYDEVMRQVFASTRLVWYSSGSLPVRVGLSPRVTYQPLFNDVAVAIRIDVLRNGELGRQLDIWWVAGMGNINRFYAWEVPMLDDAVLGAPITDDDAWSVRVRGMPELALRVPPVVSQYWSGDVTVPMTIFEAGAAAPSRGWVPESISGETIGSVDIDNET